MTQQNTRVVIASNNPGKLREFQNLLSGCNFTAVPQSDYHVPEPEETGCTFVENALLKARNAALHTGLPSLADDSGLEVDHLNGAPGIYSARYAGKGAGDQQNNLKLLHALQGITMPQRRARYQCLIVYMRTANDPAPIICQGTWDGFIAEEPKGTGGFGYDPLFWLPEYHCTAAELPAAEKNRISHRALATHELLQQLHKLSR